MLPEADLARATPPSPDEWRAMETSHLAWLRIAHYRKRANDDCVKVLAAAMSDKATFAKNLATAATFFQGLAELAGDAEKRFLDACIVGGA